MPDEGGSGVARCGLCEARGFGGFEGEHGRFGGVECGKLVGSLDGEFSTSQGRDSFARLEVQGPAYMTKTRCSVYKLLGHKIPELLVSQYEHLCKLSCYSTKETN